MMLNQRGSGLAKCVVHAYEDVEMSGKRGAGRDGAGRSLPSPSLPGGNLGAACLRVFYIGR